MIGILWFIVDTLQYLLLLVIFFSIRLHMFFVIMMVQYGRHIVCIVEHQV